MTDGELIVFNVNRSERGLVIGWVTRLSDNPLDMSGKFEKYCQCAGEWENPCPSKNPIRIIDPSKRQWETSGVNFPRKSILENL